MPPGGFGAASPVEAKALRRLQKERYGERIVWLDLVGGLAALALAGSLLLPWYAIGYGTGSVSVSLSISALNSHAGGFRWLVLLAAVGVVIEAVAARAARAHNQATWPHAAVQGSLAAVAAVFTLVAFFDSPLPNIGALGVPGFGRHPGAGAYVGVVAAICLVATAVGRYVVAPTPELQ